MKPKIKFPKYKNNKEIEKFFLSKGFKELVKISKKMNRKVEYQNYHGMRDKNPYQPDLRQLHRLYQYVILNKRTTILEFGSGWSSLIFLISLNETKSSNLNFVKKYLRRQNPFELFIVENKKKFSAITKKRIRNFLKSKKTFDTKYKVYNTKCRMTTFKGNYASEFVKLPLCNPDFIYLDGPGPFDVKNKINNFTTAHRDMMPMSCDILKMENFFIPGTIIVSDGRSANIEFLKNNFKRKWLYFRNKKDDEHILLLNSSSLGKYNDLLLKFYQS